MTLPNLIIPGAAKSGTSSLHENLRQHPSVFLPQRKEPHFFSVEHSQEGQESYEFLFEGADRFSVRGEASTSYMVVPGVPERISQTLGSAKIIFILRNPVERVASHYRWLHGLGLEVLPLRSAFLADRDATPSMAESVFNSGNFRFYYQHSSYGSALDRYLSCFDRGQIKIITFERFVAAHQEVMRECFSFLGVSEDVPIDAVRSNPTRKVTRIRGVARYLVKRATARFPRLRPMWRAFFSPARSLVGVAELLPLFDENLELSRDDRMWLARQLEGEVEKLRLLWGEDFAEWGEDFPIQPNE